MKYNFKEHLRNTLRNDATSILSEQLMGPPAPGAQPKPASSDVPKGPQAPPVIDPSEVGTVNCPLCADFGFPPNWNVWGPQAGTGWYAVYDQNGVLQGYIDVGADGPDVPVGSGNDQTWPPGSWMDDQDAVHTPSSDGWPAGVWYPNGMFQANEQYLISNGLPLNLYRGPDGHYYVYNIETDSYDPWSPENPGTIDGPTDGQSISDWYSNLAWWEQVLIIAAIAAGTFWLGSEIADWIQSDDNESGPAVPDGPPVIPPVIPPAGGNNTNTPPGPPPITQNQNDDENKKYYA